MKLVLNLARVTSELTPCVADVTLFNYRDPKIWFIPISEPDVLSGPKQARYTAGNYVYLLFKAQEICLKINLKGVSEIKMSSRKFHYYFPG